MEGMVISNRGQPVVDNQLGTVDEAKVKIYSNPYSRENPEVTLSYSARSILRTPCALGYLNPWNDASLWHCVHLYAG